MVALKSLALLAILFSPAFGMVIRSPADGHHLHDDQQHDIEVEAIIKADLANDVRKQTNADRLAKGLGPLPPTRRATGLKARASGAPGTTSTDDFGDAFGGPSVIRLRRPDGSEVGVITSPNGNDDGDLVLFDPDTSRAQKFQFGNRPGQAGDPFQIYPADDGSVFGGRTPLLGAKPRGRPSMGPGLPDFLHVGITHLDDGGLLDIALPRRLLASKPGSHSGLGGVTGPLSGTGDGGLLNAVLPDVLGGSGPLGSLTSGGDGLLGDLTGGEGPWPAQGTMWTFDPKTRKLIGHYAHPDGHDVPTYFVTGGPCQHLICLTADVDAFRNAYGDDALELHALVTVL